MTLQHLPRFIYVQFLGAIWDRISDDFPADVFPVSLVSGIWKVNRFTGISARRSGYRIVFDFGSTAHMAQGQPSDAALADAHGVATDPTSDSFIAPYIPFSRAKAMKSIWILQPLFPFLFQQGAPTGPDILMRKLRGEISAEEVAHLTLEVVDGESECKDSHRKYDATGNLFICMHCFFCGPHCLFAHSCRLWSIQGYRGVAQESHGWCLGEMPGMERQVEQ